MVYLLFGDMQPQDFLRLVETYPWPHGTLIMAFTPVEARFQSFRYDGFFLGETEQGRIFSESGELKWRRIGGSVRVVYLGNEPAPEGLEDCSHELKGLAESTRQFMLWGERTDTKAEWIEQKVPQRFAYPIDGAGISRGRAALVVEDWSDANGIPRFSRYCGIVEVEGGT